MADTKEIMAGELLFTGMTDWKNIGRGKTQVPPIP
jgi:hypothetical protein